MTAMFRPPIAAASAIGWNEVFGFGHGDDRFWASVRAAQLAILNRTVPFNVALMTVNFAALVWLFGSGTAAAFVAGWALVMAGLAGLWLLRWVRTRGETAAHATQRQFWLVNAEVGAFGVIWSALILHLLPIVGVEGQVVLALLTATVMGAAGFAAAMLPVCGSFVVVTICASMLAAAPAGSPLAQPMVALAYVTFTVLILRGILVTSFAIMARMRTQAANAEAAATIALLLGEFEANGSDWLIEVDAHGRLTHVPPRLCEVSRRSHAALHGRPLAGLIGPDRRDPAVRGAIRQLGRLFQARSPFRDLVVPVGVRGELCWWSLTGTPRFDAQGEFAGYRGVGTDVTAARRASDRIAELARFDPLTGLANRALVREALGAALAGGAGGGAGEGAALLFVDLDRFKRVNDSHGHAAGDVLLRDAAARLRTLGGTATVGRLGGDEFALVVPGGDARRAGRLARAVVAALARPFDVGGHALTIGASVGWALGPGDGGDVDTLLRAADLALYEAKVSGRGAACRFVPAMAARAAERRALEADLAHALDRGEMSLAFQPVVDAVDEAIVGFEALLRWTHPRLGAIPPARFIPVAEACGQIVRIGEWVIHEACAQAARWPAGIRIAVNLSALQFDDPGLPRAVRAALDAHGIAPDRLELEVTESVFLEDRPATTAMIARLKALGVRFALDDFGTGYSSLGYLRKAEFSRIKIDRSFVQRAANDETESTAIIQAIVALAKSLGMATTAEGTETRAEFEACRSLGCGQVQGYLFGRPMAAAAAAALVCAAA